MQPTTSEYIKVRKSGIHGTGVYAAKDIPEGAIIIEYTGRKITKAESDRIYEEQYEKHTRNGEEEGAVYIFELNKTWDIDGNVPWNTARYINHSCDPNAETENTGRRILIKALRDIKEGEEITYNYGYDIDNYQDHPCRCGSPRCVGYIADEEQWPKLKRKIKQDRKKQQRQERKKQGKKPLWKRLFQ
ncbi:SET domain-containing protein-lysine N-methyltransferase [Candidatus Woesearchaeota archaeon]|nr:SET domain-containing protein-lysine N-methyltransferase [Candidatus Woesearchaeota archaeon]